MAKSKLIKDFINSNMDLDISLQNLLVILNDLDNDELTNWARKELTGYSLEDKLPKYRQINGCVMANFIIGCVQYSSLPFPIHHLDNKLQEKLKNVPLYLSISAFINNIKEGEGLNKLITPEYYPLLQSNTNANITNAYSHIDVTSITGIVSTVKTKVLDTLLFLEKEFGNLDDLEIDISTKTPKERDAIIQKIYINLYDNSISIGNGNKIKDSNIISNDVGDNNE